MVPTWQDIFRSNQNAHYSCTNGNQPLRPKFSHDDDHDASTRPPVFLLRAHAGTPGPGLHSARLSSSTNRARDALTSVRVFPRIVCSGGAAVGQPGRGDADAHFLSFSSRCPSPSPQLPVNQPPGQIAVPRPQADAVTCHAWRSTGAGGGGGEFPVSPSVLCLVPKGSRY